MRTCEYCGHSTNTAKENCPSCNAQLPPMPPSPRPVVPVPHVTREDKSLLGLPPAAVGAVLAVSVVIIAFVTFLGTGSRAGKTPGYAPVASVPVITAPVLPEMGAPYGQDVAEASPAEEDDAPKTLEEAMTNPALRQIVERYFGREIGRLTEEDLASIQFLAMMGDTAYVSGQPLQTPTYFEYELDWPEATAVTYDGRWQDGSSLDCLTGLKTLSLTGVDGTVEDIPPMEGLERLAIYSGTGATDFTDFHKFPNLTELAVSGGSFSSYNGLSEFAKLEKLGLYATGLTDLGVLSEMTSLKSLALSYNEDMPGIQTLEGMTWLTELTVHDAEYTDLNVIGNLTGLERLTVSETQVKSLSFLSGLTKLKFLRLMDNDEALVIPPLSDMPLLEEIIIDCESTEDVSYLNGLSGLKKAVLIGPDSLEPLRGCASLQYLWLEMGWLLQDLSPLASLSELEYLRLYGGTYYEVGGISSIGGLSKLKTLDLSSTENHFQYDFISNLTGLEQLHLSRNPVFGGLSGIGSLTGLKELYLSEVTLHDSFEIVSNNGMVDIYYMGDRTLDEFSGELAKLANLEVLELNGNKELLTTLSFAAGMPQLRVLSASDNYITDVSPLAGLENLELADLSKNAVEDWRVLDGLIDTKIIR